jgi:hypothetical protein
LKKFFKYNQSTHEAEATLIQNGIKVTAKAKAHEDDLQYANQFTGLQIAEFRALTKLLEKRAKRKFKKIEALRKEAAFLEDSANLDVQEAEALKIVEQDYIDEKAELYKNLKNPPQRVKWNKLDESMLSDNFKQSVAGSPQIKPDLQVLDGGKADGETES